MPNGTAAVEEARRETFSAPITPVDEKRFESELRRMDAAVSEEKKAREKFETRIEKSINDLRGEMNSRFDKMEKSVDTRFDKIEKSVDTRFDKMEKGVDTRFDKMEKTVDARFNEVNARFEKVDGEIRDLRGEMKDLRGDVNVRMDRLDDRLWWIFGAVIISILLPVVMKFL
jgi:DNA anti-recombination protein RmuC